MICELIIMQNDSSLRMAKVLYLESNVQNE